MNGTEAAALQGLFTRLPRPDRRMLLLHYADALTPAEIGVVLEIPTAQVVKRLEVLRRLARLEVLALGERHPVAVAT